MSEQTVRIATVLIAVSTDDDAHAYDSVSEGLRTLELDGAILDWRYANPSEPLVVRQVPAEYAEGDAFTDHPAIHPR